MKKTMLIMSGNTEVARFEDNKIIPIEKNKMPLYLARGGDFKTWIKSRAIDRHRPNSRLLKKVLRLTDTDDIETVLSVNGATITDDYWIKINENDSFEKVCFRENHFDNLALLGNFENFNKSYSKSELDSKTPELTNIGSYEKCWRLENKTWWMYKQGNINERFSELFIAKLCEKLNFKIAEYKAEKDYIKSKNFTDRKFNFEPAYALVGDDEDYILNFDKIKELNETFIKDYLDILYMDALCFNMDRHTYNYGFLRNRETGKFESMAPNFDNNIALISRGYGENPLKTNNLLIDLFIELLEKRNIKYNVPKIKEEDLEKIANEILIDENINRDYVVEMVYDRSIKIEEQIQKLEQTQKLEQIQKM